MRDKILAGLPDAKAIVRRTLKFFKGVLDQFKEEIEHFGNAPSMYAGLVDAAGKLQLYDGGIRFKDADGKIVADHIPASDYRNFIGEAALTNSYLKAPYYKPIGFPDGVYRVGPLARLNVAKSCGTPLADAEFTEFHQRLGKIVPSSFHFHYARLIEALYGLERMEALLNDPAVLGKQIRAHAGVNCLEGVGMIEAPRGILIHHYKVNEEGAITWANLIVATGHNNLAINRSIDQVARHFIDGKHLKEGMLNRVSAIVRAYDPCFSCSTHASGQIPLHIQLLGPEGSLLDELRSAMQRRGGPRTAPTNGAMTKALIIGYGNPLRSDDGFGWHASRLLARELAGQDAEVITCHQLTPELAEPLSQCSRAVFIDADAEGDPGDIHRRDVHPQAPTSSALYA